MVKPPKKSIGELRAAGQKAIMARRQRAMVKNELKSGKVSLLEVLETDDPIVIRMKIWDLLMSLPAFGETKARNLMDKCGISDARRIGGLGGQQKKQLLKELKIFSSSKEKSKLIVISGPSGVGKSSITRELRNDERFWISVSATTRAPRIGEENGVDYFFVSNEKFDQMVNNGEFLEWANFANARYGTPAKAVDQKLADGRNVVLEIELQGARQVRKVRKDALLVFIQPPSFEVLKERLVKRGTESETATIARLARAKEEMAASVEFDHVLMNHQVGEVAKSLVSLATS
jgi:guanylate kinase